MSKLGIVLTEGDKNYVLLTLNEQNSKWTFGFFKSKKELLEQVGADNLSELLTDTIQWGKLKPIAINLPENPLDLKAYTIEPHTPIKLFTGQLGNKFMGAEVTSKVLELQAFDVFTELSNEIKVEVKSLTQEVLSKLEILTKKAPVKKTAPKKKTATKKAAPKKALTKKK